jgi:hypothetical protein
MPSAKPFTSRSGCGQGGGRSENRTTARSITDKPRGSSSSERMMTWAATGQVLWACSAARRVLEAVAGIEMCEGIDFLLWWSS